ncbi:MAG: hypothetical protein Q7S40_11160 [Opitutaceae bacterium]|nr:hypothetical protein [Opitutaceae bacterium]
MKSHAVYSLLTAAFLAAPLVCSAQRAFGSARSNDKTLLTGPYLLSPASPPESPVAGQQWTFVKAATPAEASRAASVMRAPASASSTLLPPGAYSLSDRATPPSNPLTLEPRRATPRFSVEGNTSPQIRFVPDNAGASGKPLSAAERRQRLQAEREAAINRRGELSLGGTDSANLRRATGPLPGDLIRFDAYVPATPTSLPGTSKPPP